MERGGPLLGIKTRVAVCLAEARYVERWVPLVDLPGKVRQAKAAVDAGDESGWMPVVDSPVFHYVRTLCKDGAEWSISPDLRLRTLHTVELVCAPRRSLVLVEEGFRGRLEDRRLAGGRERAGERALARRARHPAEY